MLYMFDFRTESNLMTKPQLIIVIFVMGAHERLTSASLSSSCSD